MSFTEGQKVWINKRSHRNVWNKETKSHERSEMYRLEGTFLYLDGPRAVVRVKTPIGFVEKKFSPSDLEAK